MEFIFALIAALSLSSIPLILGWRRTAGEEQTARVLGIAARGKKFDPEKFALQTGTGLSFNQIAIGFGAWVGGSFFAGMALGFVASLLFAIAGGLQVVETLLTQGKTLFDSWTEASHSVGPDGQVVLVDLVTRLRACPSGEEGTAVR